MGKKWGKEILDYILGSCNSSRIMMPLLEDLQTPKGNIQDFFNLAQRTMAHLANVVNVSIERKNYIIQAAESAGQKKYTRPINKSLYVTDKKQFQEAYDTFLNTTKKISNRCRTYSLKEQNNINSFLYTIQQTIGAGFDVLADQNSARKHVGNRFEELIKSVFNECSISNNHITLCIPYDSDDGKKEYKCENDLVISAQKRVLSTNDSLNEKEVVVSVKTSSKDRMGKIFIDKILLNNFVKHPQKVIGIFNNDVQRKDSNNISYTLVSGLFMVYTEFLTKLEGIYYLDLPPIAKTIPYNQHIKKFSQLLTNDIFYLLELS